MIRDERVRRLAVAATLVVAALGGAAGSAQAQAQAEPTPPVSSDDGGDVTDWPKLVCGNEGMEFEFISRCHDE